MPACVPARVTENSRRSSAPFESLLRLVTSLRVQFADTAVKVDHGLRGRRTTEVKQAGRSMSTVCTRQHEAPYLSKPRA